MPTLEDRFTPLQLQKLQKAGIRTLFDLLTFFPLGVFFVVPMDQNAKEQSLDVKYLDQANLETVTPRQGKQKFLVLQWRSQITNQTYQTYFFSVASFTTKALQPGKEFQLLLTNRNGFWNLERFAEFSGKTTTDHFKLGQSPIQKHLEVYYPKLGFLAGSYVKTLHARLFGSDYQLNLQGLVPPENDLIPQTIDLSQIHRPLSLETYKTTLDQWTSLQVYLKLALVKYLNQQSRQEVGRATVLDVEFLKQTAEKLPFSLSLSQKQAVWDILQGLSYSPKTH